MKPEQKHISKNSLYFTVSDKFDILRSTLGWIYAVLAMGLIFSVIFNWIYIIVPADIVTKKGSVKSGGVMVHSVGYEKRKGDLVIVQDDSRNICAEIIYLSGEQILLDSDRYRQPVFYLGKHQMSEEEIQDFFGKNFQVPVGYEILRVKTSENSYILRAFHSKEIIGSAEYAVYPFQYLGLVPKV